MEDCPVAIRNGLSSSRSAQHERHWPEHSTHDANVVAHVAHQAGCDNPTVDTATPNAKMTPSNPAHLGNHVDTTA
jgi:hypothetical protein